jgi:hypothetical protein
MSSDTEMSEAEIVPSTPAKGTRSKVSFQPLACFRLLTFAQKPSMSPTKGIVKKASAQALNALFAFESFVDLAQAELVMKPACCAYCFTEMRAPEFLVVCEIKAGDRSCALCSQKKRACRAVSFYSSCWFSQFAG